MSSGDRERLLQILRLLNMAGMQFEPVDGYDNEEDEEEEITEEQQEIQQKESKSEYFNPLDFHTKLNQMRNKPLRWDFGLFRKNIRFLDCFCIENIEKVQKKNYKPGIVLSYWHPFQSFNIDLQSN